MAWPVRKAHRPPNQSHHRAALPETSSNTLGARAASIQWAKRVVYYDDPGQGGSACATQWCLSKSRTNYHASCPNPPTKVGEGPNWVSLGTSELKGTPQKRQSPKNTPATVWGTSFPSGLPVLAFVHECPERKDAPVQWVRHSACVRCVWVWGSLHVPSLTTHLDAGIS